MRGVTAVALVDAVLIGAALAVVGVPLWLSLTLLTSLGAYVPYVGAIVSGVVAVLVTLVSEGVGDAVAILVVALLVQQLEGNVLHPVVMRRAVHLHPVVTLLATTSSSLLQGIPGAVVAVPVVAVSYGVVEYLRTSRVGQEDEHHPDAEDDGGTGTSDDTGTGTGSGTGEGGPAAT